MSEQSWAASIALPETSFDGLSQPGFEQLSDRWTWIDPDFDASDTWLSFQADVGSPQGSMTFDGKHVGLEALKRAVGFFVLANLPSAGLDDALESLREVWEYHTPQQLTSFPRVVSQTVQGRLGQASVRPPLELDDE